MEFFFFKYKGFALKRFIIWSGRKGLSALKHKLPRKKTTQKQTKAMYDQLSNLNKCDSFIKGRNHCGTKFGM